MRNGIKVFLFLHLFSFSAYATQCIEDNSVGKESSLFKSENSDQKEGPKEFKIKIVETLPHLGKNLFTEGLFYDEGILYEGTGLTGQSTLKKIDPQSGKILLEKATKGGGLPFFGEGITIYQGEIIQLSYKSRRAYFFSPQTLNAIQVKKRWSPFYLHKKFAYSGEGWGLTHNQNCFFMSNGNGKITFRSLKDFSIIKSVPILMNGKVLKGANELEYVDGYLFANIFPENYIVIVNLKSGEVVGRIDGSELKCTQMGDKDSVLNGIAYNKDDGTFYLTGKNCPYIYKVIFQK